MKVEGGNRTRGIARASSVNNPLVTVITVVWNRANTIEQAICSVLNQTYSNIEYIVIDGGSTDGTLEIIKKYDNRIDYWVSEKDTGIYNAMNKGISLATGEIIGILNSDDFYFPSAVNEVVSASKVTNAEIFHGNIVFFKEFSSFVNYKMATPNINNMFVRPSIFHPTCFVKKGVYNKIGMFDESFRLIADYDFLLRAIESNVEYHYINTTIAAFRHGGLSGSGKGWRESIRLLEKHPTHGCSKFAVYKNMVTIPVKNWMKRVVGYESYIEKRLIKQ